MRNLVNIPHWLDSLPDNAYISSKEITKLYGYSSKTSITKLLKSKSLPEPTDVSVGFTVNRIFRWRVGDIKKLYKENVV